MNCIAITIVLLLATATTCLADSPRTVTFYSDGALVEMELTAVKGRADIRLPGGMLEESLRIRPLGTAVIQRVDILSPRREGKGERELEQLREQQQRLNDRLQALETREEIFKAAAKSQSAKAPRKTKTNPDPMQSIRQGTDFAIAQLEAVYTARRRTEQEIRRLDARIAVLQKGSQGEATVVRVAIRPTNGRVRVHYAMERQGWVPHYDLRLGGNGDALVTLYGQLPSTFAGYLLRASPAGLAGMATAPAYPVSGGALARLGEYRLPVRDAHFGEGVRSIFSFEMTNPTPAHLPGGEASLFRSGEFWGRFRFEGISSGRSRKVSSGT
jgi:hypothetical protein